VIPTLTLGFEVRFFVMIERLALGAGVFLCLFVGVGVVLAAGLLWLLSLWGDDDLPLD
jgi:hypothetical protein